MVNRVVLIGRLGRDPELRVTGTGKSVASFSIAVNRKGKEAETDWFVVNAWDRTAEFVNNYLTKGALVAVDGRLQSRKFTTKDGTEREVVEVVADNVQSLSPKGDKAPVPATNEIPEYDPFAQEDE